MKISLWFIPLLSYFLATISCNNVRPSDPSSYLGSRMILPTEIKQMSDAPYRIIAYLDLDDCVSCELKSLSLMEDDLKLFRELNDINQCLDIIFVINREKDEMIDSALSRLSELFPLKVRYDDRQTFIERFTLPVEKQYHCFLVDDTDTIRLIGFPYMNPSLKGKYVSRIFAQ